MINATVIILTLNSAKKLNRCLQSVDGFNEIIAIDGGSVDNTVNLLKKYNCKIYKQNKNYQFLDKKIKDFSKIRFEALKNAKNNLVLFLDSDEFVTKKFLSKLKIFSKIKYYQNKISYFLIRRDIIFENCKIKKTTFWPNWQPRLVYKNNIAGFLKPVHERPKVCNKKNLLIKKFLDEGIKFDFETSLNKINKKNEYYHKIEDLFMLKVLSFNSLYFIFYRSLVLTRFFIRSLNNFFLRKKDNFSRIEILMVLIYFKFTLKLFFSLFKLKKIFRR
jgi:glycosyltransferase involved in cell wall biosynthesis